MKRDTIYISGPMRGYPNFNYDAFRDAAIRLHCAGWEVTNPANNFDGDQGLAWEMYMGLDVRHVLDCSAVAALPGWEKSKGAMVECMVAVATGKKVYAYSGLGTLTPLDLSISLQDGALRLTPPARQETILEEAQRICGGDRQDAYGPPSADFARTGKMWAALLGLDTVTPQQVALCMIALKLSRETHQRKRDNATDIAGYAYCLDRINQQHAGTGGSV